MAREHAQMKLAMWDDDDVRALSPQAQHLYFVLVTSPSLSYCGVADWRPKRIAPLARGWTPEQVEAAAVELMQGMYILVDEITEEVLIRSFVRNDGLMARERMATAMAKAYASVASSVIRGVLVHELKRLHSESPNLFGWKSEKALALLAKESVEPSAMPLTMTCATASAMALPIDTPEQSVDLPPTPSSLLLAPSSSLPNDSLRSSSSTKPAKTLNVQTIVAAWVDAFVEAVGKKPSGSLIAQAGREVKKLLGEDGNAETVLGAAQAAAAKGYATVERQYAPMVARSRLSAGSPSGQIDPNEILGPDYWTPPVPPREVDEGPPHVRAEWFKAREQERKLERIESAKLTLARRSA